jgi:putative ABC transport system permease protein
MTDLLAISLELGLAYSLVVLGVFISFRVLDFPDLTVDGSFTLGGGLSALLIIDGHSPMTATLAATVAGAAAGLFTACLHSLLRINKILSGILALTMLYSINLRIMGAPNLPLLGRPSATDWLTSRAYSTSTAALVTYLLIATCMKLAVDWFLRSEIGLVVRATGDNDRVVRSVAKNPDGYRLLGMAAANSLVALSGSLLAQNFGFADIGLGVGVIIVGFASLLVGEAIVRPRQIRGYTVAALVGSLVYQLVVSGCLRAGLPATDLKLATGLLVIGLLWFQGLRKI